MNYMNEQNLKEDSDPLQIFGSQGTPSLCAGYKYPIKGPGGQCVYDKIQTYSTPEHTNETIFMSSVLKSAICSFFKKCSEFIFGTVSY